MQGWNIRSVIFNTDEDIITLSLSQVTSIQENCNRDTREVRGLFEKELSEVRKALDENAKEKAKLEMEVQRKNVICHEIESKLEENVVELVKRKGKISSMENELEDVKNKFENVCSEKNILGGRV